MKAPRGTPDDPYPAGAVSLGEAVQPPSYEMVLDWMRDARGGRHVAFDFWARGNFTRRLIQQRDDGICPLLVEARYVDEIRWAHRRLALVGLPVDFIYRGPFAVRGKLLDFCPTDIRFDAGWGYIVAPTKDTVKARGREWIPILGYGHLMPESILDWLIEEASDDFLSGRTFVAPASLIGLETQGGFARLDELAEVTRGAPVTASLDVGQAAMELSIPYLDEMSPQAFQQFRRDYEGELVRFQAAFRKLVQGRWQSEAAIADCVLEMKAEVAELTRAAKHEPMRIDIGKLGGVLSVYGASLALAVGARPGTLASLAGAGLIGAASKTLLDLVTQARRSDAVLSGNPFFILWKLGMTKPSQIRRDRERMRLSVGRRSLERLLKQPRPCHWLCPPTAGVEFLFVKKQPGEGVNEG